MKKVLVGEKMTKKGLIGNVLFVLLWLGITYVLLWVSFKMIFDTERVLSTVIFFALTIPIFIFVLYRFLIEILMLQYLEVSQEYLVFNEVPNWQAAKEEAVAILKGELYQPSIKIKMSDMVSVKLSCRRSLGMRGLPKATLILECLLRDGSDVRIVPINMSSKKGDYLKAIELLETCGVYIYDPYELRPALQGDNIYFQEYVLKYHKGEATL